MLDSLTFSRLGHDTCDIRQPLRFHRIFTEIRSSGDSIQTNESGTNPFPSGPWPPQVGFALPIRSFNILYAVGRYAYHLHWSFV